MTPSQLQQSAKEAAEAYGRSPGTRQIFTDGYLSGYEAAQVKWIDVEDAKYVYVTEYWICTKQRRVYPVTLIDGLFYFGDEEIELNNITHVAEYITPLPPKP